MSGPTELPNVSRISVRAMGTGVVLVDDTVVQRGDSAEVRPGSRVSFGFQGESGELCIIMTLVLHCVRWSGASSGTASAEQSRLEEAPMTMPYQPPPEEGNWRLECIYAPGFSPEDFWQLAPNIRNVTFSLPPGSTPKQLGRHHQPEMFETLLAKDKEALSLVSRNHFKLEAVVKDQGQVALKVTNMSQHCAAVGEAPLRPGETMELVSGNTLSFAGNASATAPDNSAVTIMPFLTLRLVGPPPAQQPWPWLLYTADSFDVVAARAATEAAAAAEPIAEEYELIQSAESVPNNESVLPAPTLSAKGRGRGGGSGLVLADGRGLVARGRGRNNSIGDFDAGWNEDVRPPSPPPPTGDVSLLRGYDHTTGGHASRAGATTPRAGGATPRASVAVPVESLCEVPVEATLFEPPRALEKRQRI